MQRGDFIFQPFVYNYNLVDPVFKRYEPDTSKRFPIYFFIKRDEATGSLAQRIQAGYFCSVLTCTDATSLPDYSMAQRISLSISILGVLISFVLGLLMGGIAGYFGGKIDNMLMRFGEIIMAVPGIYLLLALRGNIPHKPFACSGLFLYYPYNELHWLGRTCEGNKGHGFIYKGI